MKTVIVITSENDKKMTSENDKKMASGNDCGVIKT